MRESEFWKIIATSINQNHSDRLLLIKTVSLLDEARIRAFYWRFSNFVDNANRQSTYMVASTFSPHSLSDDSYLYFRAWLVAQGEAFYYAVVHNMNGLLSNSDYFRVLAELDYYHTEDYLYVAADAYERAHGKSIYDSLDSNNDEKSIEEDDHLPWSKLKAKHLVFYNQVQNKLRADYSERHESKEIPTESVLSKISKLLFAQEAKIEGLGIVKVGERLRHKKLGLGVVKSLTQTDMVALGKILFDGDSRERSMIISAEHFAKTNSP